MPSCATSITRRQQRSITVAVLAVLVAMFCTTVLVAPAAHAAAVESPNPAPSLGNWPKNTTNWPCAPTLDYSCSGGGYQGQDAWGYAAQGSTNRFGKHNCTAYAAYRLEQDGVVNPGPLDNAKYWATNAAKKGIPVDQTPAVGAIAQWTSGQYGHVGYVDAINPDGSIVVSSDSYYTVRDQWYGGYTQTVRIPKGAAVWPANFIHFKPKYGNPKISSVMLRDGGVMATFAAPTMPSGVTIRGYTWQAIDTDGRWLWTDSVSGAQSSPLFIPYPCGACRYQLSASYDGGQTKWSNAVAATPVTAVPKISSVKFRDGGVMATFTAPTMPSGVTIRGYTWQAMDANTNQWLWNGWVDGAQSSPLFIPYQCSDSTSCKYQLSAVYDGGQTAWSNAVATAGLTAPVLNLVIRKKDVGTTTLIVTAPSLPSGVTIRGYQWEAYTTTDGNQLGSGWFQGASPLSIQDACGPEESCKYRVRASVDGGASPWSNYATG